MNFGAELPFILIGLVWLSGLSYLYWKLLSRYTLLTQGSEKKTLPSVLESMAEDISSSKKHIDTLLRRCDKMEENELLHIQKIGLVRFNPFKDTGGDQSFIIALVNAKDTGVVISGLYSRSGTRWYAKRVVQGKGLDHDLSDEEKKALSLAKAT